MATTTYAPIQTYTLGSNTSTITFTSIPQTYTDLVLVVNGFYSGTTYGFISFNGSSSDFSYTRLLGYSGGVLADRDSSSDGVSLGTNRGTWIAQINNYSNSSTFKTALVRENGAADGTGALSYLWRSTSAITSITLTARGGGNFASTTTATLYGIANAQIEAPKATGGTITYDNTYFYHTFGASGTFTPTASLTADVLVVAGGGGGGGDIGGGGGAGGYRFLSSQSLTAQGYTCTIGAGGSAGSGGTRGGNGVNSSFSGSSFTTITSSGGGAGGSAAGNSNSSGAAGGSGGGAAHAGSATFGTGNAGSYSPVEGFNGGGQSSPENSNFGGGGGGSASVGITNTTSQTIGSNGGNPTTFNNITFAGGGGGGARNSGVAGGLGGGTSIATNKGGGGNGGTFSTTGFAGATNTGGGGGGGGQASSGGGTGGTGGSGVVVVRYLKA